MLPCEPVAVDNCSAFHTEGHPQALPQRGPGDQQCTGLGSSHRCETQHGKCFSENQRARRALLRAVTARPVSPRRLPTFRWEETSESRTSSATVLWRFPNSRACAELQRRICGLGEWRVLRDCGDSGERDGRTCWTQACQCRRQASEQLRRGSPTQSPRQGCRGRRQRLCADPGTGEVPCPFINRANPAGHEANARGQASSSLRPAWPSG